MSTLQYRLLVRHHFIFLTIFLESDKHYETLFTSYCSLVGFFESVLAGGVGGRRCALVCANCVAGKTATRLFECLCRRGSSQLAECAPVPLWFHCASPWAASVSCGAVYSPRSDFSSEPHGRHSTKKLKIKKKKSIIIILWWWWQLWRFTRHKWQFYINHLSDILWRWLVAYLLCTVSVACASGGRGLVCWSIFSVGSDRHSTCST